MCVCGSAEAGKPYECNEGAPAVVADERARLASQAVESLGSFWVKCFLEGKFV